MNNIMVKNLTQSIRRSIGRYIAIAVIIALGAGMFVGLRSTKMDMVATGQIYTQRQNMFDLRIMSSYGWYRSQLDAFSRLDGIEDAEGVFYSDLIVNVGEDGEGSVYRFYTLPEKVNKLVLLEGRMPQTPDECLADGFRNTSSVIGTTLVVAENNKEDALEELTVRSFKVVGRVSTPLYMDMNRGNTSVGSGSISNYFFVPEETFDIDYYKEIHVTLPGEYAIYTKEYNNAMSDASDHLKPQTELLAQERLTKLREDGLKEYWDGKREYIDGVQEYNREKAKAERDLKDAFQTILDGEQELRAAEKKLDDGEKQVADGKYAYYAGIRELKQAKQQLEEAKSSMPEEILNGLLDKVNEIREMISQNQEINQELARLAADLAEVETFIYGVEHGTIEATEEELQEAYTRREEIKTRWEELDLDHRTIRDTLSALGILDSAQELLDGLQQLIDAQAQITEGEARLAESWDLITYNERLLREGRQELEEKKQDFRDGLREYYDGFREAKQKLTDAETELADAQTELEDAWKTLSDMTKNDVYILDRSTNMGYNSLDSSSDIVAGVSKVFPAFFLLVAALVCITTMTRMVDEERTQIGTLKALGYSSMAIMSKYLIYAGSSAVLGCALGVLAGSIVFPTVLWEAYKIMLFVTPGIVLKFDWVLALVVVLTYTAAMLLVTWYCCYKALEEVPAELIRPKAPTEGKQLIFEKLPLWENISFLNKVAIRNIFRYRQRLAMMLLGIGGCTALLMTGFGLRDSIEKIVDVQFREVTTYDMQVYFREDCDEEMQNNFRETMAPYADKVMFFNQVSGEISADFQTRDISIIAASEEIADFWNFHSGSTPLSLPGTNEVLMSAGMADLLSLRVGDDVVIRDPDMEELTLTISGIYDNHVHNFAIITPETVEAQWGRTPEQQMAFVVVREGVDPNSAGAAASGADPVMNVTVSEQQAEMVATMMKALDLVVIVVVFCAGLLAAIVLYNLTNINITERIREIATIKVLGFNASETAMYVFKENLVLSIMGTLFGLPLGKLLLRFVISQIKIDLIWIKARLEWPSLLISVVLTILMAFVVDFIFYFKLEKINMAEALKSVE